MIFICFGCTANRLNFKLKNETEQKLAQYWADIFLVEIVASSKYCKGQFLLFRDVLTANLPIERIGPGNGKKLLNFFCSKANVMREKMIFNGNKKIENRLELHIFLASRSSKTNRPDQLQLAKLLIRKKNEEKQKLSLLFRTISCYSHSAQ